MGELSEGTSEEEPSLEDEVQAANEAADEFLGPEDEDFNEEILHESIEETLERTKKALSSEEGAVSEGKPDGSPDPKAKADGKPEGKEQEQQQPAQAGQVTPAQSLTAEDREWIQKQPPEIQGRLNDIINKRVRDLESGQQQWMRQKGQEIHEYRATVEPIFHTVSPWAKDWAKNGLSLPQGVALLAQTHDRMLKDSDHETARLIADNVEDPREIQDKLQRIKAHLDQYLHDPEYFQKPHQAGRGAANGNGVGYNFDISKHPEFQSLRNQMNSLITERQEVQVKSETDKIRALRDEVDADGNKPYERILDQEFLHFAQPLVTALRTPPRGPDGKFISGPQKTLSEAYKIAYRAWLAETGQSPQTQAASHQPSTQPQMRRKPAEPVSMRPRSAPAAAPLSDDDPAKFRGESVEDTVNRALAQLRG